MKTNFTIILVKETLDEKGVLAEFQTIDFFGSRYQSDKAFFALSFCLCRSEYSAMYLCEGKKIVKQSTFKRG